MSEYFDYYGGYLDNFGVLAFYQSQIGHPESLSTCQGYRYPSHWGHPSLITDTPATEWLTPEAATPKGISCIHEPELKSPATGEL